MRIADPVTEGASGIVTQPCQDRREILKCAFASYQGIEKGSRSRSSASAIRRCESHRGVRSGGTRPTWLLRSVRRREWKCSPRERVTGRLPDQLASTMVASKPAMASALARPPGLTAGVDDEIGIGVPRRLGQH